MENKNLWVVVETEEGKAKNVGYELLGVGRTLADKMGQQLVALVMGKNVESVAKESIAYGADQVLLVEGDEYETYNTDAATYATVSLIKKYAPAIVLYGATNNGRDLAPRVACQLETGLTADCTELDVEEGTNNLVSTRPTFGGNLLAVIMCPDHHPQMSTVRSACSRRLCPMRAAPARSSVKMCISPPPTSASSWWSGSRRWLRLSTWRKPRSSWPAAAA